MKHPIYEYMITAWNDRDSAEVWWTTRAYNVADAVEQWNIYRKLRCYYYGTSLLVPTCSEARLVEPVEEK